MRCSGVEGSAAAQRLAAFATQMRPVLAERAIADYDEIAAASALLAGLDLHGWIITGEAKFTQQAIVQKPIARGGDAVLTAKADQPTLVDDIATLFSDPQAVAAAITTRRTDLHGSRIEVRDLRASSALSAKYCDWAGLRQVLRSNVVASTSALAHEINVRYSISSLARQSAPNAWGRSCTATGASKTACTGCAM